MERSNPGQNSEDFVHGNWGKDGEKLDLRATHEIRGSNPTNHKKKIGAIFVGNFRIRNKINKTRLENKEGGSEIMINVGHDTNMM